MPLYSTFLVIQSAVREKVVENEGLKKVMMTKETRNLAAFRKA